MRKSDKQPLENSGRAPSGTQPNTVRRAAPASLPGGADEHGAYGVLEMMIGDDQCTRPGPGSETFEKAVENAPVWRSPTSIPSTPRSPVAVTPVADSGTPIRGRFGFDEVA